ncbi:MAG: adenosylcobinamide-phosphate synthase [Colwellia sp.]|jgi:adenosylcobinamide-phosphate synthase
MATGASVLNFTLGGSAIYHGKAVTSVRLGCGNLVTQNDIIRSINLVNNSVVIFIFTCFFYEFFIIYRRGTYDESA